MIGERLRELREWRGLTAVELAAISGLTKGCISHIECGRRTRLYGATLIALARALRVPPARLLDEGEIR